MKKLRVTMPDGSRWDVPAGVIADNSANYYAARDTGKKRGDKEYEKVFLQEVKCALQDNDGLINWAANNMDWKDVEKYAKQVKQKATKVNYQEGWVNGEKDIVDV